MQKFSYRQETAYGTVKISDETSFGIISIKLNVGLAYSEFIDNYGTPITGFSRWDDWYEYKFSDNEVLITIISEEEFELDSVITEFYITTVCKSMFKN